MSNPRPPGSPRVHCRKQSLYLPETILNEIEDERRRSGRSLSALLQAAWIAARDVLRTSPPAPEP